MALEGIFQSFATEFDATLVDGMNDVVRSGIAWAQPQLRALLVLYVVAYALGFMLTPNVSARQAAYAALRGLLIAAAVQSAHYVPWVQEMFFTTLPNQIAAALNGPRITVSSAQQFDVMWSATLRVNAFVLQQASGWLQVMDRAMAWLFALICLVALSVMFVMWFVSRIFMAIVICMGPFLIPLYLFRATRGFVEGWIGKLVGLTVLQLASSILLRALLVVITARFSAMQNNLGSSIDMMLGSFAGIAGLFWMGALLMVVLPTAVSIGAAMGASQAATAAALLSVPSRASALAGRINRAVPRPGRA